MKAPRLLYPLLIETKFARQSENLLELFRKRTREEFLPLVRAVSEQVERERYDDAGIPDGSWASATAEAVKKLERIAADISGNAEPLADSVSYDVEQWTNKEIKKLEAMLPPEMLKLAPTGLNPENIRGSLRKAWSKNYAGLITAVSDEVVGNVSRIVYEGFTAGESYESIKRKILADGPIEALKKPPFNTAKKRARIIARDQIGKLNGKLVEKRQTQIGIDSYIWRSSMDERVRGNPNGLYPRAVPSHWNREGKVFKWNAAPEGGHPGEAILCRCTAEPYIEGVTGSKGVAGGPGPIIQPAMSLGKKIKALSNAAASALNLASSTADEAIAALSAAETSLGELDKLVDGLEDLDDVLDDLAKKSATAKLAEKVEELEKVKTQAQTAAMGAKNAKAKAEEVIASKYATAGARAQASAALSHIDTIDKTLDEIETLLGKAKAAKAIADEKLAKALAIKKAKAAVVKAAEEELENLDKTLGKPVATLSKVGQFSEKGNDLAESLGKEAKGLLLKLKKGSAAYIKAEKIAQEAADYSFAYSKKLAAEAAALATQKAVKAADLFADKYGVAASEIGAINAKTWKRIANKTGSNPGGIYEDESGARWIVKVMDEEHAINELLAAKLYKAAGVQVSEMQLVEEVLHNGQRVRAIAGKWIDGLEDASDVLKAGKLGAGGYIEGAGADIWLANWDAVGLDMDNILKNTAGDLVRIDVGAAMKFRAQGQKKPFEAGKVPELETYLNGVNDQITPILSKYSADDVTRSLERVANMSDETIDDILDTVWKGSKLPEKTREEYREALKGRRDVIKLEWEKRGGPALSGASTIVPKSVKIADPFKDFTPGDDIPGLSPEASTTLYAKYDKNGKVTMKNALEANNLDTSEKYPDEIVEEVNEWQAKAAKALEGKGPFPKPLDPVAIKNKLEAIKAAEAAKIEAAKKVTAGNHIKNALSKIDASDKALDEAIESLEAGNISDAKFKAGLAQALAEKAVEMEAAAEKLGYGDKAIKKKAEDWVQNAEAFLDGDEFREANKKLFGQLGAKKGPVTKAQKEAAAQRSGGKVPEALFDVNGKVVVSTTDGRHVVFAGDNEYAETKHDLGIETITGQTMQKGMSPAKAHWVDTAKKINGPMTQGDNRYFLEKSGVTAQDLRDVNADVFQVLQDYTGGAYSERNKVDRGEYGPNDIGEARYKKIKAQHKKSAAFIREHVVEEPFVVWRGSSTDYLENVMKKTGKNLRDLPGTVYTEHAHMSTTTTHAAAFDGVLFRINVPKGASAVPARHFSHFGGEDEIIFPPVTEFYISSVRELDPSDPDDAKLIGSRSEKTLITVEILPEAENKKTRGKFANRTK